MYDFVSKLVTSLFPRHGTMAYPRKGSTDMEAIPWASVKAHGIPEINPTTSKRSTDSDNVCNNGKRRESGASCSRLWASVQTLKAKNHHNNLTAMARKALKSKRID
jgi:hypothetical protein